MFRHWLKFDIFEDIQQRWHLLIIFICGNAHVWLVSSHLSTDPSLRRKFAFTGNFNALWCCTSQSKDRPKLFLNEVVIVLGPKERQTLSNGTFACNGFRTYEEKSQRNGLNFCIYVTLQNIYEKNEAQKLIVLKAHLKSESCVAERRIKPSQIGKMHGNFEQHKPGNYCFWRKFPRLLKFLCILLYSGSE